MMRKLSFLLVMMLTAACGSFADPVYVDPTATVFVPTATFVRPTAAAGEPTSEPTIEPTVVPPTDVPTEAPTLVPTEAPTLAPTEAPTTAASSSGTSGTGDPLEERVLVFGSAAEGERLFNETITTGDGVPWACSTCHNIEGDVVKIGPSQAGVFERAKTRVAGEGPYTYIYNSILHSQDFVVPEFVDTTHMPDYSTALTEGEAINLVAYLITLE